MRSILIVVASIFTLNAAQAEDAKPPADITLTVTAQDIGIIGQALGARPFSEVNALLQKLDAQINAQRKLPEPKTPEPPANPALK